jgi:cation transport ATPase
MGSRERKRTERRKRKRRSAERTAATAVEGEAEPGAGNGGAPEAAPPESFQERMARRSEERNAEARAKLKPLARGERPTAVTIGAVIAAVLAVVLTVSAVLAIAGVEVRGETPQPVPLIVFAIALWVMAWGMWRARYWAVLGFQMLLLLTLLASALGLVQVSTAPELIASLTLLGASGTLFYFLIRALARIQMPEPPGGR